MDGWLREYEGGMVTGRDFSCSACEFVWSVEGRTEYGTWWPERDDDLLCEDCGKEGGEV